ncbi:unnamed protein product [Brachionus calyciflorus]|uniref:Uncharacterized protein n=1 Tax=Brachionus calyciflorus TaxID=104777 RepID=A0A813M7T1_9BILA|nr:unnamed protein product [Brachionus calyciflorus]
MFNSGITPTPSLDPRVSKWTEFWANQNKNQIDNSYVKILILSSSPFLCVILVILIVSGILSIAFTFRKKYKRRQVARHVELLENFLILYNESKEERKQRDEALSLHELKSQFNLNKKNQHEDFKLPDEDRVPIALVKDALARSLENDSNNNGNIKIDKEVIQVIDNLINPPHLKQSHLRTSVVSDLIRQIHRLSGENENDKKEDSIYHINKAYEENEHGKIDSEKLDKNKNLSNHGITFVIEDFDEIKNTEFLV